jgi:ectoine hydroxylase-related dioxygenase (phytanoyl-CoA dioxygenase family)
MHSHVHWADRLIHSVATSSVLGEHTSQLLGVPLVRLWGTSLISKSGSPTGASDVRWHRDMTFWQCTSAPRLLTYWIALDDADAHNGCLEFAIASHRSSVGRVCTQDGDLVQCESEVTAMRSGQVSVHHCLTGHRSNANRSHSIRRALTVHLMDGRLTYVPGTPADNHMNVALIGRVEPGPIDNLYFPVTYDAS